MLSIPGEKTLFAPVVHVQLKKFRPFTKAQAIAEGLRISAERKGIILMCKCSFICLYETNASDARAQAPQTCGKSLKGAVASACGDQGQNLMRTDEAVQIT